jgi:hypothetical protein
MELSSQKIKSGREPDPAEVMKTYGPGGRMTTSGVDTPGCDCGKNGWGRSWHSRECSWGKATRHPDHPNLAVWERRLLAAEGD